MAGELEGPDELITLKRAAQLGGLHPKTLRDAAKQGRLQATMPGNEYLTTRRWLHRYLAGRKRGVVDVAQCELGLAQEGDTRVGRHHAGGGTLQEPRRQLVLQPQAFDVIVASNLFGDILADVAAAVAGSIGVAPSANLNPERDFPSMFEPVHGSAPDIAGQGIANPIGAIWAGAMMLEHLGHSDAAATTLKAIMRVLAEREVRTPDLGGRATTAEFAGEVEHALS